MLANVGSASVIGVTGTAVGVEVHVSNGLPGLTVVGLPDTACREARDRVRAALLSSRLKYPDARITVNLAPSGVRKAGAGLDLAIAVGVLAASSQLPPESVADTSFLGELGLDGTLRPVPGIVPMLAAMPTRNVVVPAASLPEALVVTSGAHGVHTLTELVEALHGRAPWPDVEPAPRAPEPVDAVDLAEVRGHPWARRALEVAAAGGHHLLMVGPPGAGKTMLAERLPGLLPDLGPRLSLEVTCVHSAAGLRLGQSGLITRAPLRRPHHSASAVSLIGGGSHHLRPGEVSLAHGGVLFLDELGEFPVSVLDALRQPLEEGCVRVSRAHASATMPARFQLVAAMNPCPCGYSGFATCRCAPSATVRYARRVSGPLLDRFDLRIMVEAPAPDDLLDDRVGEASSVVATRVAEARRRARERGVRSNAELTGKQVERGCPLDDAARRLLAEAVASGRVSARGVRRIRTVALTLDDLAGGSGRIGVSTLAEAMALRADVSLADASVTQ